jgi:glycosyltransferase involved in cell wall biosynthesis
LPTSPDIAEGAPAVPDQRTSEPDGARPLRVLQFTYGHGLYGAERWVLTLLKHLDRGRVVSIVGCLRDADTPTLPLIDEARRLGIATLVIEATRHVVPSAVRGLRAAVRAQRVDLVHSHSVRQDVVTLLATRGLSVPILSTPHGWEARASLKERARMLVDKAALVGFDAVAPLSEELRASLRWPVPVPRRKVHLIPNGVDLSEVDAAQPAEGLLPGQATEREFVVGYVGQLIKRKGVDVLIDALARLPNAPWACLVVGDGPERAALEEQARRGGLGDRLAFLGYREDRLRYLKRFDLLVLPSFREGVPRCVMEALAAGIPCAGSRIPGIDAVLQDGVTGDTFPPGDAAALAAVIARHMQDRQGGLRLAAAGGALVRATFSATAMARAYERLYTELTGRTAASQ